MRRILFSVAAMAVLALGASGAARADFTVGSAKTDLDVVVGVEHASFSAQSTGGPNCEATGHIVYKNTETGDDFSANIVTLTIEPAVPGFPAEAFLLGHVTSVKSGNFTSVGDYVSFYASDSGMPGGMGDTFMLGLSYGPNLVPSCKPPATGTPITSGNIVITASS